MATNINTILSWFRTGLKPTENQFSASWRSFWHKDEAIPQSAISGLVNVLNAKAEKTQFDAHKAEVDAAIAVFNDYLSKSPPPFEFEQPTPESVWAITHNMGKYPSVTTIDEYGYECYGQIQHISKNEITITFENNLKGIATLN